MEIEHSSMAGRSRSAVVRPGSAASCASSSSHASACSFRSDRTGWASSSRLAGPLYIGPWQELSLGRALHRHQQPPSYASLPSLPGRQGRLAAGEQAGSSNRPSVPQLPPLERQGERGDGELEAFVQAFKAAAEAMDEERAGALMRWSPLFLPTIQSLMQPAAIQEGGAARGRLEHGTSRRLPGGRSGPTPQQARRVSVRAQRERHIQQMRMLYSLAGDKGEVKASPSSPMRHAQRPPVLPSIGGNLPLSPAKIVVRHSVGDHSGMSGGWDAEDYVEFPAYVHQKSQTSVHSRVQGRESGAPTVAPVGGGHAIQRPVEFALEVGEAASSSAHTPLPEVGSALVPSGAVSQDRNNEYVDGALVAVPTRLASLTPYTRSATCVPPRMMSPRKEEEWEDEVDDLLEWTRALPGVA